MFTFSVARAAATFAVNPTVSEKVAVISFAALTVYAGPAAFWADGFAVIFFAVFGVVFFAGLAMASLPSRNLEYDPGTQGCQAETVSNLQYQTDA